MSNELSEAKEAIKVISPSGCHMCGRAQKYPYEIRITSIKSSEEGWIARGKGRYIEWAFAAVRGRQRTAPRDAIIDRYCPMCGKIYQAIEHTIPIQCAPFPCPKCGELQNLHYKIRSIITDEESFEFEVEIECEKCKKKKSFTKGLKKVLEVIKIEVKPTGITVRKA